MEEDSKTNETYVPLSRGIKPHIVEMGGTALQIYIYLLTEAKYIGKGKGTVEISLDQLAQNLELDKQTVWRNIKNKLLGRYIEMKPARNQHETTIFTIKKYKTVKDFKSESAVGTEVDSTDSAIGTRVDSEEVLSAKMTTANGLLSTQTLQQNATDPDNQGLQNPKEYNNKKILYREIFDHWNNQKIIVHKVIDSFIPHIKAKLKNFSVDEIKEAISNYSEIRKSDDYKLTYDWTLGKFLKQTETFDIFLTKNNPWSRYRNNKTRSVNPNSAYSGNKIID